MGMVLTRTHCYVAEFGLNLRPSTSYSPAAVHALPGSCPGAPPTGHRAQTPWRPFLPQPMHCEHPQTWRTKRHDMGMRVERGKEGEGVEHPIAGRRVWEWEKREIKWWAHSFKTRRRKNTKEVTLWPPGNPPNYKGKDRLSMKQHLHVTNMNKWKLGMDTGIWSHAARIKTRK